MVARILDDKTCQHETEDGSDVSQRPIGLWFVEGRRHLIVCWGTAFVDQQFVAIDAEELVLGEHLVFLEPVSQRTSQRVALDLPELRHLDACGVQLECCTHGREQPGFRLASQEYERRLVFQRVDGIDDVIVAVELEAVGSLFGEDLLQSGNLSLGIDGEQTLLQGIDLYLTDGLRRRHQLAIDVGDTHPVAVYDGQQADAAAHQALGTPRPDTAYAKYDYPLLGDMLHGLVAQQQLIPTKYCTVCCHRSVLFGCKDTN